MFSLGLFSAAKGVIYLAAEHTHGHTHLNKVKGRVMIKKVSAATAWLRENDPRWVEPATKAARTRATPYDMDTLGEILAGSVMRKVGGVWKSMAPTVLVGCDEASGPVKEVASTDNPERNCAVSRMEGDRVHNQKAKRHGGNWRKQQAARSKRSASYRGVK